MPNTLTTLPPLRSSSRLFRAGVARGADGRIVRDGGDFGAGLITSAAVITRGEALGHYMWIDHEMIARTADLINASEKGTKGRFTHPSMSGDGLGKAIGRWKQAVAEDSEARADLHLYESAHKTPDGALAAYVMDLAEEDPAAFGVSIAFDPDYGAEDRFVAEHEDEEGDFHSPDPDNEKNYPHARIASLAAADVVDEPAANPNGLFHRGDEICFEADRVLAYALGLSVEEPESFLGLHPSRIRAFVQKYLAGNNLRIVQVVIDTDEVEKTRAMLQRRRARLLELERNG